MIKVRLFDSLFYQEANQPLDMEHEEERRGSGEEEAQDQRRSNSCAERSVEH